MRAPTSRDLVALIALALAAPGNGGAQDTARRAATPTDAIDAIVEALRSHQVVALGEGPHNNEQGHRFRLALIRDPRFTTLVNDIVVESGSARYQDVMDRFTGGEEVSDVSLRDLRENTVAATPAWDGPMYDEFYRAVRDLNAALPRERRLRVLLGDPPIQWDLVKTRDDYRQWALQRDSYPADMIQREVVARGRRALVIYGDGHLQARSERPGRSLAGILETSGTKTFIVTSTFADLSQFQPEVASWKTPVLALLKGTLVGAAPYEFLFGPPPPVDYFRNNPRIEDHYDAVLYLGPASSMTISRLPHPRCSDPAYVQMRVGRMLLTGASPAVADRLAADCAAAARR